MSLRTPRSMGDIASRRFCTHFDFPDRLHKPALPSSPPPLPPLTTSQLTESSSSDDSDDDFHLDFPQPPSISPALRRMRSSPWHSAQLAALDAGKQERRHSVSPLFQPASGGSHSQTHLQYPSDAGHLPSLPQQDHIPQTVNQAPDISSRQEEDAPEIRRLLRRPIHEEPLLPHRMERFPPPAPAPSIPLPRLPRIIRKVASMRSDSKHKSMEPPSSSRGPVPKIKSLKFLSGSGGLGTSATQSQGGETRKRSWSLGRPTSLSGAKAVPIPGSSYVNLSASASDDLRYAAPRMLHAARRWPHVEGYSSLVAYPNPSPARDTVDQSTNIASSSTEAWFDLSRGSASPAPSFMCRAMRSNPAPLSSATSHPLPRNSPSDTRIGHSCYPEGCHSRRSSGLAPPSHLLYSTDNRNESKKANSGTQSQVPKSFIDITPERKGGRAGSKTRSGMTGLGAGDGRGTQVGAAVKQNGEKMRRLFVRATSGVADWGRQLAGRGSKSVPDSSTSGGLARLAGTRGP